jgi:hypothetical protein
MGTFITKVHYEGTRNTNFTFDKADRELVINGFKEAIEKEWLSISFKALGASKELIIPLRGVTSIEVF